MKRVILGLIVLSKGFSLLADEPVSARFTVDLRSAPSGVTVADWATYEASKLSEKFVVSTREWLTDSDGDGLPDVWELAYGLNPNLNDSNLDSDDDGRSNLAEYNAGTNPIVVDDWSKSESESGVSVVDTGGRNTGGASFENFMEVWAQSLAFQLDTAGRAPDADKDGMPDWWEEKFGLNVFVGSATVDTDGDGRSDLDEYNAGTNPIRIDDWTKSECVTKETFTTDTRVIVIGGNPSFDTAFAVMKTSNGFICDTGGLYYDWDGDGIPNWWEARFSDSKESMDATADLDGDGLDNYSEFVVYSDPTDSQSRFTLSATSKPVTATTLAIKARTRTANGMAFELSWQSVKGRTYRVYSTATPTKWPAEPIRTVEGTGEVISVLMNQAQTLELFKVTVELMPEQ